MVTMDRAPSRSSQRDEHPGARHGNPLHPPRGDAEAATANSTDGQSPSHFHHVPVLLQEVQRQVPAEARLIVDATLGGGGHAEALLAASPGCEVFGCDRDRTAIEAAASRLRPFGERILLKQIRFSELAAHVQAGSVDFLIADLGVSSPQFDESRRGFSFSNEGPLDMRMDSGGIGATAYELVNHEPAARLREILHQYGEERFAGRIVRAIEEQRASAPIETTTALAKLIFRAVPAKFHRRIHPATRTFQALRIAVNEELEELRVLLDAAPHLLASGGRICVISFHSLEDRMVKNQFRAWADPCDCPPHMPSCICGKLPLGKVLHRKPITPREQERERNPRSRSAKLRTFERG